MIRYLQFTAAWFLAGVCLMGCATVTSKPQSPAQAVYAVTSDYATALTAAVQYGQLPRCAVAAPPCSDEKTLATLRVYSDAAYAAIKAAEVVALSKNATVADQQSARLDAIIAVANFVDAVAGARR